MPAAAPPVFPNEAKLLRELGQRLRDARLRRRFTASLVAERASLSRFTLVKVEKGDPSVTLGSYLRVMAVLGLEKDLSLLAANDPLGRRLQDAELSTPRRRVRQPRTEPPTQPRIEEA